MARAVRLDALPPLRLYAFYMRASHVPLRRLCAAAAVLALPTAIVLAVLVVTGNAPWWEALVGLAAVAGALTYMVRRHLAGLAAVGNQIEDLAEDRTPTAIAPPLGTAAELSSALAGLSRKWADRNADLRTAIAVNEAMVDAIPDPILLLDHQRHVVRINAAARDLFGARIVDRAVDTVLRDPNVLEAVDEVLAGRQSSQARLSVPGAVERHFDVRVAHLAPGASEGVAVLLALYDVTGIRRAEQMRADFVANASHELRTPLASLHRLHRHAARPARKDDRRRATASSASCTSRRAHVAADRRPAVADADRAERAHAADRQRRSSAPSSSEVDALSPQARGERASTSTSSCSRRCPRSIGDRDELTQVFQNLVDNAIKYGRAGARRG